MGESTTLPWIPIVDDTLKQRVEIHGNQDISLTPGLNYTISISTSVEKGGWLEGNSVSNPFLNIDISSQGDTPRITRIVSPEVSYDVHEKQLDSRRYQVTTDRLPAGSVNRVLVRLHVPEGTEEFSVKAQTGRGNSLDTSDKSSATKTFDVSKPKNGWEELANLAESRAQTAVYLNKTYDTMFHGSSVEEVVDRGMRNTFVETAWFIKDIYSLRLPKVKGFFKGGKAAKALTALKGGKAAFHVFNQFNTYYESTKTEKKFDDPWVGPIIRAENRMLRNGVKQVQLNRLESAGRTSLALEKLANLAEAEAEAWRNHNREKARKLLNKQREVVTKKDIPGVSLTNSNGVPFRLSLPLEAAKQRREVDEADQNPQFDNRVPESVPLYFAGVANYSGAQKNAIESVLPLTKMPSPNVELADKKAVRTALATRDTIRVKFTVSNAESGGPTSQQGYLSLTYPGETLRLTDVKQVGSKSDNEKPRTVKTTGDEEVTTADGGRKNIDDALADIYEQYESGETNTYVVTFERVAGASEPAYITYRTAFEPLIHGDSHDYVRAPATGTETETGSSQGQKGPQGWRVFRVEAAHKTNYKPIASFTHSPGDRGTFDGSGSRDSDGRIMRYEWDFNGDGDIETTGKSVSVTYSNPGSPTVTLTVTDDDGATDSVTKTIEVSGSDDSGGSGGGSGGGGRSDESSVSRIEFDYTDHGGNTNLEVNGDRRVVDNLGSLDGQTVGGATVTVWEAGEPSGNNQLAVTGSITSFSVGGQEFNIDNVTFGPDNDPITVVKFTRLTPSPGYRVGDRFTSNPSGVSMTVEPYVFSDGEKYRKGSVSKWGGGIAPGNTNLRFDISSIVGNGDAPPQDSNDPPTAEFTYSEPPATMGSEHNVSGLCAPGEKCDFRADDDEYTFDASGASDSDGIIKSYVWHFGDGSTATGKTVTHSYSSSGDYTVELTVTDDDGATDTV
ncbi:MAG: PKD domain-containing protein, partial [Halobacteria archaeon]|nr:PKD domain-containing protein [Halobacteria archaeon]